MAKAFQTWTVLPHDPIDKVESNLWYVTGMMPDGRTQRAMCVARRRDGRLVIHNAIALEEPRMKELEAFGEPTFLVVPNSFHRQDAKIWKDRYPKIKVLCPAGGVEGVSKVVAVDGTYAGYPSDPDVELVHFDGCKDREGVMTVHSDGKTTAVINDMVMNITRRGGFWGFMLAPTGRPAVPRISRWAVVSDKRAFRAHLDRLAGDATLARIIVSHGRPMTDDPRGVLRAVGAEL